MRRLLALAAGLTVLGATGAAHAAAPASLEDKHVCVITNSEKHEGYCVKAYGVPDLP